VVIEIVGAAVYVTPNTRLVVDGHSLPFKNGSDGLRPVHDYRSEMIRRSMMIKRRIPNTKQPSAYSRHVSLKQVT
jgi:hypothetical protein